VQNTKSIFSLFSSVLPTYFDSEWSFAQCRVTDQYAITAIKDNQLVIVSRDAGNYYSVEVTAGELNAKMDSRQLLESGV
jgi:hypothetical protein